MSHLFVILFSTCIMIGILAWSAVAARALYCKRNELAIADKQLAIYNALCVRAQGDMETQQRLEQAKLSWEIYQNVAQEYNHCIEMLGNRPVAWILGYQKVSLYREL